MSYTKTIWATDDIITAEKLNHAENGIADASKGPLDVVATLGEGGTFSVDTSLDDMVNAWEEGRRVQLIFSLPGVEGHNTACMPMTGFTEHTDGVDIAFDGIILDPITPGDNPGYVIIHAVLPNSTSSEFKFFSLTPLS